MSSVRFPGNPAPGAHRDRPSIRWPLSLKLAPSDLVAAVNVAADGRTSGPGEAMITRRQFLELGAVGGAAVLVPGKATPASGLLPGGTLDPTTVDKYVTSLVIPPVMPPLTGRANGSIDRYAIAVRQFRQQILPPAMPATTVWGYGSAPHAG